jgi:hypothetical protein
MVSTAMKLSAVYGTRKFCAMFTKNPLPVNIQGQIKTIHVMKPPLPSYYLDPTFSIKDILMPEHNQNVQEISPSNGTCQVVPEWVKQVDDLRRRSWRSVEEDKKCVQNFGEPGGRMGNIL